jgi:predicted enzyme related to lactoylglutathione lyase
MEDYGATFASKDGDQTVWAPFPADTRYFGPGGQQLMVNFRVRDLDAMLAQLRTAGVDVDDRVEEMEYGRFGWATDVEGNRFELWEPS